MKVAVVPWSFTKRAEAFVNAAGWELEEEPPDTGTGHKAALAAGAMQFAVLYIPKGAEFRSIHTILLVHDGSPSSSAGMKAADRAAVRTGAEIVIIHVPEVTPAGSPGSLPAPRMADHSNYDWQEWQDEFIRRFCRCSPGVVVRVETVFGPIAEAISGRAAQYEAELIVATWKGDPSPGKAEVMKEVLPSAPCPILLVREPPSGRPGG